MTGPIDSLVAVDSGGSLEAISCAREIQLKTVSRT